MDNIRNDSLFGNSKVIVGSKYADLILETLGKVYVKTGNSSRLLNDVFKLLDNADDSGGSIILVGSQQEMESMEYPGDGYFVFNTLTKGLYLSYDDRYILLIEAAEGADQGYVRRKGDTMTGQLEIITKSAPLIVASSKLVQNFNAEYINGFSSEELAKKALDEYITGNWTFNSRITTFNSNIVANNNIRVFKDIVTSGSIGSPEFASGFGGYGWRFDANTNMLTVDYLVVRKAMKVYELVINNISATNGALWITNSSKCEKSSIPLYMDSNFQVNQLESDTWYIPLTSSNIQEITIKGENLANSDGTSPGNQTFINHRFAVYVKDTQELINSSRFQGIQSLMSESNFNNDIQDSFSENAKICYLFTDDDSHNIPWYTETDTPKFFFINKSRVTTDAESHQSYYTGDIDQLYLYYKYFAISKQEYQTALETNNIVPHIRFVTTDTSKYPSFKEGDIIRCQKYSFGNMKYYDALVGTQFNSNIYAMFRASGVFDKYIEIKYDDEGNVIDYIEKYNTQQYLKTTSTFEEDTILDDIAAEDDMVQVGSITDVDRQNSVYISSAEDNSPYIDIITGLNRPDWSVLYYTPKYKTETRYTSDGDLKTRYKMYVQTIQPNNIKYWTWSIKNDETTITYYGTLIPTKDSIVEFYNEKKSQKLCKFTTTVKVRIGNLSGITNDMFKDNQPYGYGLYGENVFLTGEFYLNNGNSVVNFSEEQVLIKFKNAGISINKIVAKDEEGNPIVDEEGNPTYEQADKIDLDGHVVKDEDGNPVKVDKTEIVMTANQIKFKAPNQRNDEYIGLFGVNEDGTEAWLDVQGSIKAHGLYIYPEGYTPNEENPPEEGANVAITPEGNIIMKGTIYANSGQFGSINIGTIENESYWPNPDEAKYIIWQKAEKSYSSSLYARAGFKLGIGKYRLFDAYPSFLEIYNYSNSLSDDDNRYGIKVSGHMNAAIWASVLSGMGAPSVIPAPNGMVAGFFDGTLIGTGTIMGRFGAAADNQYPGYYNPSTNNYSYYPGISFNFGYDLDSIRLAVRDGIIIGMSNDKGSEKSYVTDSYGRKWVDSIPGSSTEVQSISLNYTSLTINIGSTRQLTATISPSSASGNAITWTSSNELVATVSNGLVYALNIGSTTITAEAGGRTAKCDIVVSSVSVTGISVSPSSATMTVGDTRYVYATISPSNATNSNYKWITSDSSIASVTSSGYVSARSSGKATITAISEDGGYSDSCIITVNAKEET